MTGKIMAVLIIVLGWYALAYFAPILNYEISWMCYGGGAAVGLGASWFLDVRVSAK